MKKKIFFQFLLLAIISIIIILVYKTYFKDKDKDIVSISTEIQKTFNQLEKNLIQDIKYIARGKNGEEYVVKSKFGEIDNDKSNLILMKKVSATISKENTDPVSIYSDSALYNKLNYSTSFYDHVVITYDQHIITSDNMDLFFEKNMATITNNIIYKNLNTKIEADKIEIDLITKDSKILMTDKFKKVSIESLD